MKKDDLSKYFKRINMPKAVEQLSGLVKKIAESISDEVEDQDYFCENSDLIKLPPRCLK